MATLMDLAAITFIITAFERPRKLANLCQSILRYYPQAQVLVGDSGSSRPLLPPKVRHFPLPYDCGLSRMRNKLVDLVDTPYLFLLEEDLRFTTETRIEPLWEVLHERGIEGVVSLMTRLLPGRKAFDRLQECRAPSTYASDLHRSDGTLHIVPPESVPQIADEALYIESDQTDNWFLARTDLCRRFRWTDELKMSVHFDWFLKLQAEGVRSATCMNPVIVHDKWPRSAKYLAYRRRKEYPKLALKLNGLKRKVVHPQVR